MPKGIKDSGKVGKAKKPKTNTNRDTGDPSYDLIKVFEGKDIGKISEDEYEACIIRLQNMRLIRVTTAKKQTALDTILAQITVDRAREILSVDRDKDRDRNKNINTEKEKGN
jgi:hypothetical protein